ncbi:tRNase Z TRZ3, mitochondrial-like [Pistacia vera]|uniref:tRNase Z TRZ3, mitochondrial-like n=1 Tax=Pistacia vera TaxID=55513 RepID=UPI001263D3CC|nr:tRNase Z TRZ3, mitochondrial-like [Pistacia vera]
MQESKNESSFRFNKRRSEGKSCIDMPNKNPQHKVPKLNPTSTVSYVQILGTGMDTQDTSPSVLLFVDEQRFIFNAGEGLQRFSTEHKIILPNVDHIFLSRVCSETAGGLPGLLFTLADFGGLSVNVWGPSDLKYLVDAMKSFIRRDAMVHARSFGTSPSSDATLTDLTKLTDPLVLVNNEVVKISAILLKPNFSGGSAVKPGELSVIYVCELPELMGKFDPDKAMALGLSSGPKYDDLKSGKSVQSDCGTMIHPSDVMGPSVPGPIVLLVDCPTEAHVLELLSVESLSSYYADCSTKCAKTVNCIIHLSPTSVTGTPNYQICMKRFGSAQHIMAGHEMKNAEVPILKSNARLSSELIICVHIIPLQSFSEIVDACATCQPDLESASRNKRGDISLLKMKVDGIGVPVVMENVGKRPGDDCGNEPWAKTEKKVQLRNCYDMFQPLLARYVWRVLTVLWESKLHLDFAFHADHHAGLATYEDGQVYDSVAKTDSTQRKPLKSGNPGTTEKKIRYRGADSAVRNLRCIWISHIQLLTRLALARILALRHDLLKATYEDGQVEDAVAKKHSTTKEAIEVGSGAYRIVLTTYAKDIQRFLQLMMQHA